VSLRLRLALWYGGLTGLVVLLISVFTYAEHTRSHYDDVDQTLVVAAAHFNDDYGRAPNPARLKQLLDTPIAPGVALQLYGPKGEALARGLAQPVPRVQPLVVLAHPSVPPFDRVAGLAPALLGVDAGRGRFGIGRDSQGRRWRVYVLPVAGTHRYVVAAASLDHIDAAVSGYRKLALLLTIGAALITLLAGWLLASRALRPVGLLTETAGRIARSRRFSQRVPVLNQQDEMGRMATTFNQMLESLEQAYELQHRFIADASHELRAPLTAIQGNLELLERQPTMPDSDRAEAVHEASREAHRMARLVADLLALARADAGASLRKERVELDWVVLEALREARHLAHGQRIEVEAIEPVLVQGDGDRLKQLILILLDNAIRYTPANGQIALALRRDAAMARVTVRDSGMGVPPEDLPHVFERFYRADPARARDPGGTGLGLAIAKWIVEQHGGEIEIASEPGHGAEVTVRLPAGS
jgi:two-component system OmpR family sensor kinase